jgi:hypothetical protein
MKGAVRSASGVVHVPEADVPPGGSSKLAADAMNAP